MPKPKPLKVVEKVSTSIPAQPADVDHPVHKLTPPPAPTINQSPFDHSVLTGEDWLK